jgi:hypothetical protein
MPELHGALEFKSIEQTSDSAPRHGPTTARWNTLIRSLTPEPAAMLRGMLEGIYFKVVDHYMLTLRPAQLALINRSYARTWTMLHAKYELPKMDIRTCLHGASLSQTIPLQLHMTEKGAWLLLPNVVIETAVSRAARNYQLLRSLDENYDGEVPALKPDGWTDDAPSVQDVWAGLVPGPTLNALGEQRAYAPFGVVHSETTTT